MDEKRYQKQHEITGVLLFAVAVLLGLSYYLPLSVTGVLGTFLRTVGTGLIGVTSYAIPVLFIYAAIDFFVEKRSGVTPVRVLSVLLLLICISAFLAILTISPTLVKASSGTPPTNEPMANKAIALLWKSGMKPSLLGAKEGTVLLPGGVIGGSIALGLQAVAAKAGAILIILTFILSQIVLIFNVSITKTAANTARVIRVTSQKAGEAIKQNREAARQYEESRRRAEHGGTFLPINPSPFNEVPDGPQGFIDLEGTPVRMNEVPRHEKEKSFDFDLSQDVDMAPESRKVDIPYDPKVDIAFSEVAQGKVPDYVKPAQKEDEPSWYDLPPEPPKTVPQNRSEMNDANAPSLFRDTATGILYETDEDGVIVKRHEKGGTQIRVPNLPPMEAFVDSNPDPNMASEIHTEWNAEEQTEVRTFDAPPTEQPRRAVVSGNVYAGVTSEGSMNNQMRRSNVGAVAKTVPAPKASAHPYVPAPTRLLAHDRPTATNTLTNGADADGQKLVAALQSFGIETRLNAVTRGPAITRYELVPAPGIKVSRIVALTDDIALAMASAGVRIEAPIPGKSAIGIEIPNRKTSPVYLGNLLESDAFKAATSPLTVALGKDIPGKPILCDLATMPHLLIAGATGSGKSVCINSMLISILCKASPDQVKMIMIDPKVVELSVYNGIPHLLSPVVTDPKKAANTLNWVVGEMLRRYAYFAEASVRDFKGYNEYQRLNGEKEIPLILVVIDELADLMQVASKDVEESISRLTALARAAGIHLLIATQRPSVDVITGVIKANIPSRIAFAVSSQVDSRTILDMVGAEKLLGKGDMLYYPQSAAKPQRGQGAFVSDKEVEDIVRYHKQKNAIEYDMDLAQQITSTGKGGVAVTSRTKDEDEDELLPDAVEIVLQAKMASVSILQRKLGVGYPRASRLIDRMEMKGYIGPFEGSKPRKLLITQTQWLEIQAKKGDE